MNIRIPYSDRIAKTMKKDEKGGYYFRGQTESSGSVYEEPGKYQVLVKVMDIFGNDTNKLLEVQG